MKTTSQKIQETSKANQERWKSQTIVIDEDLSITRLDEQNWHIQFRDSKDENYYRYPTDVMAALPAKMLAREAKGSVKEVLETLRGIQAKLLGVKI